MNSNKAQECTYCKKISNTGISLVKNTGKILNFCKSKCLKHHKIQKGKSKNVSGSDKKI